MQITHLDRVFDDFITKVVGLTKSHTGFYATTGEPNGEGSGVMVATDKFHHLAAAIFAHGGATELTTPDDQSIFEHSAIF